MENKTYFEFPIRLLMILVSLAILFTANGNLAWDGKPIGTDFSNVYAADVMVNNGRAVEVWDWLKHFAVQDQIFEPELKAYFGFQTKLKTVQA